MDNHGCGYLAVDATTIWAWCSAMVLVVAFTFWMSVHLNQVEGSVKKGFEGFVEALYFTVVTITTVGYRDDVSNTDTLKWFTILVK